MLQAPAIEPPTQLAPPTAAVPVEIPPPPAAERVLPVLDVEVPASPDDAAEKSWRAAEVALAAKDFKSADQAFADLGKRADPPTREAARLARALLWINNGKAGDVQPVVADLAANATTPSVRRRARELLQVR